MTEPILQSVFAELYGHPVPRAELVKLRGDASSRSYFRASVDVPPGRGPRRVIVMQLPEDATRSDEGGKQPRTERLPFLEVAALLGERGLPVPEVYAEDLESGVILLEDLGDVTLHDALGRTAESGWPARYEAAVDLLVELHERCEHVPEASVVSRRRFDRELLAWELEHFRQWGLEAAFGELDRPARATIDDVFRTLVERIASMPVGFVHRDYQSKNLMVAPDGALRLIDFQDALLGPRIYDLVALLCDSYVDLAPELQESMIARYAALRRIEPETLRQEFWWVALHRKLKDAGRFIYIDRVRRNPDFLRWFPQSLVYVGRALEITGASRALESILESKIPGFPDAVSIPASMME